MQAAAGADNKNGLFLNFGIAAAIKEHKHGQKLSVYFQRVWNLTRSQSHASLQVLKDESAAPPK